MVKGINRSYEDKVKRKYSEFKTSGIGTWNAVSFKKRWINMYTDKSMIKELFTDQIKSNFKNNKKITILDFGGGDGTLISIIKSQLGKYYNVDAFNMDLNDESLQICKNNNPEIKIIKNNLLNIYEKDFADVILCRFVMQYQSKEEQRKIISNAQNSLKKGGLFFVLWPSHPNKKYINELESEIVHVITGKDKEVAKKSRHFPSKKEMENEIEVAGLKVILSDDTSLKQYYTVEGWDDRFHLDTGQKTQLTKLFNNFAKKYPEAFETIGGYQTHQGFHCLIIGKK
jgi:SAM-dependent methyltransferase